MSDGILDSPLDSLTDFSVESAQTELEAVFRSLTQLVGSSLDGASYLEQSSLSDLLVQLQVAWAEQQQQQQILQAQCQRERSLMLVIQRLRQSLDPNQIAEQTVAAVKQLLQVDRVVIYQFQADDKATIVAEAAEGGEELLHTALEKTAGAALIRFCQSVGSIVLNQVDHLAPELAPELAPFVEHQQATALLTAPVRQADQTLGLISAHQRSGSRNWQLAEIELLQQLSTEVAIALQHSELYQQSQRLNADLEQQVQQRTEELLNSLKYESTLKRITERVRDSLDESVILEAALQELTVILQLAGCNAALYDLNQGTSTVQYDYTASIPTLRGRVAQMENFSEIYRQLKQALSFQFCSLLPNPERGRVAMLACPIFVDSQASEAAPPGAQSVLGDLWLIHQPDHMFSDSEIRLVQQVASQCAIAIRQARLYQAAQVQVRELAELNRLKDEFLSTVSHELRTPITNIKMAIQMLRNSSTDDRRAKYIGILEQEAVREAELINDLLDLQQLQAAPRPIELEEIDLQDWLPKLLEPFGPRFAARQHQFQMQVAPNLPAVASEVASLRRILAELLNNACKYTAPGGEINLTVRLESDTSARISFTIRNQAVIPEVEISKIFDKFYRCPNADPWKQGGTGLGLALVQKLVERLQGEIQVTSQAGWTQFQVTLPALSTVSPTPGD
ncbi:MAG: GAF domain-containing sensor histidine kinase [Pegethrix bostrychoides GSE-TBD4-15B]|uniref:histidine kinase n=1 Tax=Pegethrix bostrychoides GSE-TBD4-15B TaxID=2839662 RepID=A0A951PBB3_9CYAN|nr:GAF domain-containing sensor histidine kinase [Pegethrix bostrychoides GSE-TBD4-15B]